MGDWPLNGKRHLVYGYPTALNTYYVTSPSAAANTKGNWIELIASTPFDGFLNVSIFWISGLSGSALFDVGIGAAGSEVVIAANLASEVGGTFQYVSPHNYDIPLLIPAGSRIAIRHQTYEGSLTAGFDGRIIGIGGFGGGYEYQICDTYGASTADSGGTDIDSGAVAETKGAWTQMTAALTRDIKGIRLGFTSGRNFARSDNAWHIDVGIGGAGSEQLLVRDFMAVCGATGDEFRPRTTPIFPVSIPSGTRVSVRSSCNGTDAADRHFDCILYTFS